MNKEDKEPPDKLILALNNIIGSPSGYKQLLVSANSVNKDDKTYVVVKLDNKEIGKQLWDNFSPKETLFQLWDFRDIWNQAFNHKPEFIVISKNKQVVGFLPLEYDMEEKKYKWFGSAWPEDNMFFVQKREYAQLLLKHAPKPLYLNALDPKFFDPTATYLSKYLSKDSTKWVLDISNFKTFEDYLKTLKKKHRHQIRYAQRRFLNFDPVYQFIFEDQSHLLKKFKELSIIDYERNNDLSEYRKEQRLKVIELLYKKRSSFQVITLLVYIQKFLVVYDILAIYKNKLYILTGASDVIRFPGANTFATFLEIDFAIKNKLVFIDCMQDDNNWKHRFFKPQPMWKIEIPLAG